MVKFERECWNKEEIKRMKDKGEKEELAKLHNISQDFTKLSQTLSVNKCEVLTYFGRQSNDWSSFKGTSRSN